MISTVTTSAATGPALVLVLAAAACALWPEAPLRVTRSVDAMRRAPGQWSAVWPVVGVVLGVLLLSPDWWPAAVPAGVGVHLLQRRSIRRPDIRQRLRSHRQLALVLEMVAACLKAGLMPATALSVVLHARGDPIPADDGQEADPAVRALVQVSALLGVGAGSESAWAPAAACPELAPLAVAATRTARGGVALAAAFRDRAGALRQECARPETARASRAGVLMTAPLGVCFLPAFLCLGLAPVVIGLLGSLQLW